MIISDVLVSLLVPLLIILGGIVLALAGWLVWSSSRRKKVRAPSEPPSATSAEVTAPQDTAPHPFLEVERATDGWAIYVEGEHYDSLEAVPDPQVRTEVVDALRTLAGFARDYVVRQQRQPQSAARTSSVSPESRHSPAEHGPEKPDYATSQSPSPLSEGIIRPEGHAPAASAASAFRAPSEPQEPLTRRVTAPDALLPTIDFAHEISAIIDELQGQAPDLQDHSVRLTNLPGGGISFAVDGKIYGEIDEIPDAAMRDLIRRATREWERR